MEDKRYCVNKGKYGYEIHCCDKGGSWESAVKELIFLTEQ